MKIKKLCKWCGIEFETCKAWIKNGHKFCSKTCYNKWQKGRIPKNMEILNKNKFGCNNPNWKGGITKISKHCLKCGKKIGFSSNYCKNCFMKGNNNPNWKGGPLFWKMELHIAIRNLREYYDWRLTIFKRDNFICKKCGKYSDRDLNAHHIEMFSKILYYNNIETVEDALNCRELWSIENGITLCKKCHVEEHKNAKRHT